MKDLHYIQMQVMRELMFNPRAHFSDLNIGGLSSDHLTYHVRSLIRQKFIVKKGCEYCLTDKGKEFANSMDTEALIIEKQPKLSVAVICKRGRGKGAQILFSTRLKEPFYGYRGFITGKVRSNEKVVNTAKRELKEETNLEGEPVLKGTIQYRDFNPEGKFLEAKIFFIYVVRNPSGELMVEFPGGRNEWVKESDVSKLKNLFPGVIEFIYEKSKSRKFSFESIDRIIKKY